MAMAETLNLGPVAEVRILFSYPNNCNEVCFLSQTLEQTVTRYLKSSIERDGFLSAGLSVAQTNGNIVVTLPATCANAYKAMLPRYLEIGMLAHRGSLALHRDGKWLYNWRYFLPHGVSMTQHKTVQLLHFPPDYVLERDQDYLSAHTTLRWAELLVENGLAEDMTARYQNIIDIAPIAAPSSDGSKLEGIYSYYNDYIHALLKHWLPTADDAVRPMVAFGSPVRTWIKEEFGPDLRVLSLANLEIDDDTVTPTLAANHPSYIYNAASRLSDDPATPEDERMALLMKISQQDLVAARWQVLMGEQPASDPEEVLNDCKDYWSDPNLADKICEITRIQALNKSPEEAAEYCGRFIEKRGKSLLEDARAKEIDRRLEELAKEIGPLDSREPDQIDPV